MNQQENSYTQIPIEFLHLSKNAGALIVNALFKNQKKDEAIKLTNSLGNTLLPTNQEDWDGAKGIAIKNILSLDDPDLIARLTKDVLQTQDSASQTFFKNLLIFSAKSRAEKCFDWILHNAKIRKSKKAMEVAFFEGSYKIAERVKRPTTLEAEELWGAISQSYITKRKYEFDDILWTLKHFPPFFVRNPEELSADLKKKRERFIDNFASWGSQTFVSQHQNENFSEHFNQLLEYLHHKLHISFTDEQKAIICFKLTASGPNAAKSVEYIVKQFGGVDKFNSFLLKNNKLKFNDSLDNPGLSNATLLNLQIFRNVDERPHAFYWSTNSKHYSRGLEHPEENISIMTVAIVSQSKPMVDTLLSLGFKLPKPEIFHNIKAVQRIQANYKTPILAFYDSLAIQNEIDSKPLTQPSKKMRSL